MASEQEHQGTFAEGQAVEEHHPEDEPDGEFARGQQRRKHEHESDFAEGQAETERHPETEKPGDFAEGLRQDD